MPQGKHPAEQTTRVFVTPSPEITAYLDDLVKLGIHGRTRSEVAKTLIGREVERLIREGFLKVRS